ncbi:MAG TPA: type II toxin-antitoxin system VapC family toxin, partial [Arachnia sp.]|nr:type II toxin-antitoxin system VapC family toxin [Arachnia sp.]
TRVTRLARRHGLSAYDALYLELAVRHGATLAIFDLALERAARAEGVAVASWDRGWETSPRQRLTPAFYGESVDGTGE